MNEQTKGKTHMDYLIPKPHIRTTDILDKEYPLTIKGYGLVKVYDRNIREEAEKGALRFEETKKYLIVNQTQLDQIAKITGSEFLEDWMGKKIVLHVEKVRVGRNMEDAIRVKAPTKATPATPAKQNGRAPNGQGKPPATQDEDQGEQEKASKLERQEYFNIAYGTYKADPELVNACALDGKGDYDKALEYLKKQIPQGAA